MRRSARGEPRRLGALAPASLGAAALLFATAPPASAHPVRIGRYAEIPYGIRADHPYPAAQGGPRRTGRLAGRAPQTEPRRIWERTLRHRRPRGPVIAADGTMYVGSMGGLSAHHPDGTERWSLRLGSVHAAPTLAPSDDVVVVTRGGLVAVVAPDGVLRHSVDLGAPARSSPLVLDDGSVLVATIDRLVHRLDASLRRVFAHELPDAGAATVSQSARGVLAVPGARTLTLLDPDGRMLQQTSIAGRITGPAGIADDGTLWVPTLEGVLFAIDPSGRIRSRTELGSRHYEGAAVAVGSDGAVRVPTMSEGVVCVGPGGTERWRHANPSGYNAPASIDGDDTTLVVDRIGSLLALAADGTERWRVAIGSYSFQPPVLGPDGTLFVTTERGALSAWRE